jgi:hypothetical protein
MIVIDLRTVLKNIFGDLYCSLDSLNGQIILAQLFKANSAIDDCVNQSPIIYILLPYLDTLVVLLLSLLKKLIFV